MAVIRFPGTNADLDVVWVARKISGLDARVVWYRDFRCCDWDSIVIPGGFSYGDWLRAGAIAANSEAMEEVRESIERGTPVLGICNGFQILVESGLLPGAFLGNLGGRFICRWVRVEIRNPRGPWLSMASDGSIVDMPIAHGEGRYFIDAESYRSIVDGGAPVLKYYGENPNGSSFNVAGIASRDGSILGLMPHPERASESIIAPSGSNPGGRIIWESIGRALRSGW